VEAELNNAKSSLQEAKQQSIAAMEAVEAAAIAQSKQGMVEAVVEAEKVAGQRVLADIYVAPSQSCPKEFVCFRPGRSYFPKYAK
jgi:hypothetical protein